MGNIFQKGKYLGICNFSSCKTELPAVWYNHGSRAYYCKSCAKRLNEYPSNQRNAYRMFGHELCTLV